MRKQFLLLFLLITGLIGHSQNWMLKLSSTVELRAWRLTSTAEKSEKALSGANIKLYKGTTQISETSSNAKGDFMIDVPAGGEFILTISFPGCNTKKFNVSTSDVPENVGKETYKPTVNISGFLMSKPLKGVEYIGLNQPLVKVEYKAEGQNFDKDEAVTNNGLNILSKIYDAETALIQKFCATNKSGDDALKNHNCPAAKEYYEKAINMLPGEQYPVEQLAKAELCLKNKKAEAEAVAQDATLKAEAAKIANEKAIAEKTAKDKEQFNKTANNKIAKEKELANKDQKNTSTAQKSEPETIKVNETETSSPSNIKKGHSNHIINEPIGKDPHKEAVVKADGYFKMKRYDEAKTAYEEALQMQPDDAYSKGKLEQISKLVAPK
ncbi:MAG: tetratricopeptide repeat protein [Bacteroidetes bacterium]|nr:tetratricopeptide repeat protein [Bacteroidota bacterium]